MNQPIKQGFLLFLMLGNLAVFAQQITVKNAADNQPISDVFVYTDNHQYSGVTDVNGELDISEWKNFTQIICSHPSFVKTTIGENNGGNLTVRMKEAVMVTNEIVIAANRLQQDATEIPQRISSVTQKQIAFRNPATAADLLEQSGQVFVQKSQYGGGSPMIRGFAANAVLLVVDGVRMNNAIYRSGNLQNVINIDPNIVSSSEVLFGPGSVMYGSDAMGGVMNFNTQKPTFSTKQKISGGAFIRTGSAANEMTGHANLSLNNRNISYYGAITYTNLDDLEAGSWRTKNYKGEFLRKYYVTTDKEGVDHLVKNKNEDLQKYTGFNLFNATNKIAFKINPKATLTYSWLHSHTSDIPRYDALAETISDTDSLTTAEWYYGPQNWDLHSLQFVSKNRTALFDQIKTTLAYQTYTESRNDRDFGSSRLRTRTESVDLWTLNAALEKHFENSSLYYGIDAAYNDVTSEAYRQNITSGEITPTSTRYPNAGSQYSSFAMYASYFYRFSPKLSLNTGLRYNYVGLTAKTDDETAATVLQSDVDINNQAINGLAGLIFKPNTNWRWTGTFSTGFRSPNVDDVGKVFDMGDVLTVPNPDLEPEYTYNEEMSIGYQTSFFQLNVTAFHSLRTNTIVTGEYSIDDSNTITIDGDTYEIEAQINAGKARIYGVSLFSQAKITNQLVWMGTVTYTKGYELEDEAPLRHVAPVFGRTSLTYTHNKLKTEVYSLFNLKKKVEAIPSSEFKNKPYLYAATGMPAWCTANVRVSYELSQLLSVVAGVENIMDMQYRTYSSGISAPGRNFTATIRAKF